MSNPISAPPIKPNVYVVGFTVDTVAPTVLLVVESSASSPLISGFAALSASIFSVVIVCELEVTQAEL
jgi:hypothetical protein